LKSVFIIFILLAFSCSSPVIKSDDNKKNVIQPLTSKNIMNKYSRGLDKFFSREEVVKDTSFFELKNIWNSLTWSEIMADGSIISLSSGTIGKGMLFVLSKEHSFLSKPGATLTTRKISGFNGVLVRPYDVSEEWAGAMMIHELVHLSHMISGKSVSSSEGEYLAYMEERKALDILTENKLTIEQDTLIKEMKLNSYIQVIWHFNNNRIKFQEKLMEMDRRISKEKPKSMSELEMRLGFYAVSISLGILEKGEFDKKTPFKGRGIQVVGQVLKEVGKY
jgi:hypothetical protein